MNKKTKIQENKAITLIALVITILILIILAGVAINLTLGQNGLVARAKMARGEYSTAEAKEKLEQEILNVQIQAVQEGKEFNLKYLKEKIDKTKYEITLDDEENSTTAVVKEISSNYYLTVDSKLKVTKVEEKAPKPQHVKFSELTWASGKASVELNTKEAGTIEYKVGKDGIYQTGTTISNLNNGDIMYVRVNNNGTYTDEETLEIKDTIEPEEFTIKTSNITTDSVKIAGSTQDNQTGLATYSYVAATKTNEIIQEITGQTATEYTITGLEPETEYVVYMLAYDNAGNVRKSNEIEVKTKNALRIKKIETLSSGLVALDTKGRIYTVGSNSYGELGIGNNSNKQHFTKINVSDEVKFIDIATNAYNSLALDTEGNIWTWGKAQYSGIEQNENLYSPVKLDIRKNDERVIFKKIFCPAIEYMVAIDSDDILWMWGNFYNPQNLNWIHVKTPIEINLEKEGTKIEIEDIKGSHMVLDKNGDVWTWGYDEFGSISADANNAGRITNSNAVKSSLNKIISGKNIVSIGSSIVNPVSYALDANGNLYTWGNNRYGLLGNGGTGTYKYNVTLSGGKYTFYAKPVPTIVHQNVSKMQLSRYSYVGAIIKNEKVYACGDLQRGTGYGAITNYPVELKEKSKINFREIVLGSVIAAVDKNGVLWIYRDFNGNIRNDNDQYMTRDDWTAINYCE